jgi:hypothetical protein
MLNFLPFRSRALATAVISIAVAGVTSAATFAPTAAEVDAMHLHEPDAHLLHERLEPQVDASGRVFYAIDDMRYAADAVATDSAFTGRTWPGGVLYYQFDAGVAATRRQQFREAAAAWASVAPLTFVESTGNGNWVQVRASSVNSSYIGMVGGSQEMNIANWNSKFTIAHEIGHALGQIHEHCRGDRNTYVRILLSNIDPADQGNFEIRNSSAVYGAYDFDSVMHYIRNAFSTNGQNTIEPTAPYASQLYTMGQTTHLSAADAAGMAQRYGAVTQPVGNDHFVARETLASPAGSVNRNTVGATKEVGEPNHAGFPGGASVWFTWRATGTGTVTIDTLGSNFDTMLHVYQGSNVTSLTSIAGNDDIVTSVETESRVTFAAVQGETYQIAVDGWGGESGIVTLNWQGPVVPATAGAKADFNGDGQSDLIWQDNVTGQRAVWLMNGTAWAGERFLPTIPTQWQIAGTGDFNADGKIDIVWQNSVTGARAIWLMNGTAWIGERLLPTVDITWQIAGTGDFNADGQTDLVWQNTATGQRAMWLMNGSAWAGERFLPVIPTQWDIRNR